MVPAVKRFGFELLDSFEVSVHNSLPGGTVTFIQQCLINWNGEMSPDNIYALSQSTDLLAVIVVLILVALFVVRKFRSRFDEDPSGTSDTITNFRELHVRGQLSDQEYRTIKSVLATKLQDELKDNGEKG